ncbi:MAG: universal stress protein [Flavobacteriales bacterium]|nr:universal stress protein [Flavobacteriales bacterium]
MKRILVATDYSEPANNAVEYAAQLARAFKAELVLFNVFKMSIHASNAMVSTTSIEIQKEKNKHRLLEQAREINERFGINVDCEIGKDDTVESLKKITGHHPVNLVVMGIQSGLVAYKMFGNTTTAAIKLMRFPLLVVPNQVTFQGINKIMYACDETYLKDGRELSTIKKLTTTFGAQLEVFHVLTNHKEGDKNKVLEDLLDELLSDVIHTYRYVHNPSVYDGILAGLDQNPADLLVMIHHKPGFMEALVKGSHSSQMTVNTHLPLLVIPNEQAN